ncbi:MAG: YbaK/EbsC family protein [Pontimonas sp.]|nr:YbaK/EbsC family protein [Pontimonas sp.]
MAKGVERFAAETSHLGLAIVEHTESTHTAQEAADAVGAPVGAIVKSLLFIASETPLLVLVSGPNRVNAEALGNRLGRVLHKADADIVKSATGFSIGGVPPFGHPQPLETVMDEDFFALEELWAAAGSPTAVFSISPQRLQELSNARVLPVT